MGFSVEDLDIHHQEDQLVNNDKPAGDDSSSVNLDPEAGTETDEEYWSDELTENVPSSPANVDISSMLPIVMLGALASTISKVQSMFLQQSVEPLPISPESIKEELDEEGVDATPLLVLPTPTEEHMVQDPTLPAPSCATESA